MSCSFSSTIGNRAVGRLLSEIGLIPSKAKQAPPVQRQELVQRQEIPEEEEPLQGKFEGGPEEETCPSCMQRQEIPEEEEPLQGKMIGTIQRQEIPEEEEPLQGKFENKPEIACPSCFAAPIVQRQEIPEEEELLQGKFESIQRQEIPEEEEPLQTKRENNTGMPDNLKAGVESLSGIDMSDVRVHYNSSKPAEVGALAYTQGTDIHVAPGQEKHLPHEAWHVVQQAQGRVNPTMQLKDGVPINDDEGLEHEADVMKVRILSKGNDSLRNQLFIKNLRTPLFPIIQGVFTFIVWNILKDKKVVETVQNHQMEWLQVYNDILGSREAKAVTEQNGGDEILRGYLQSIDGTIFPNRKALLNRRKTDSKKSLKTAAKEEPETDTKRGFDITIRIDFFRSVLGYGCRRSYSIYPRKIRIGVQV